MKHKAYKNSNFFEFQPGEHNILKAGVMTCSEFAQILFVAYRHFQWGMHNNYLEQLS